MANTKLSSLTGLSTPASSDEIYINDVSDTTDSASGSSRKITFANLVEDSTITLTNKTLTSPTINSPALGANSVDAITEIATAIKSGSDAKLITGTAGTSGDLAQWNADGDLVDGPTPPSGTIVGHTDTQTLTNKTIATGNNFLDSASTTGAGVVEIATIAETDTGTSATLAVSPDGLQGSLRNLRFILFTLIDSATSVATDTTIGGDFPIPFSGTIVQDDSNPDYFAAYTDTAGTTGTMVVDVHLNGTTIMTTNKLDIETTEKDTTTAATQPDLTTTTITAGDILTFDVDAVHSGTAALGLKVMIAIRPT